MRLFHALILAPLALANSATAQPATSTSYRASGTEPFWSLTIDRQAIRYRPADGREVVVRTPRAINGFAGESYRTPRLSVNVVHSPCNDGMSDRLLRDRVTVTTPQGSVSGCGGGVIGKAVGSSLANTAWTITAVDGAPVRLPRPATVRFSANRIEGNAGCNGFNGRYSYGGGALTTTAIVPTIMACPGGASAVENAFFRMVARPTRVSWEGGNRIVLHGDRRTTVTLTRAR